MHRRNFIQVGLAGIGSALVVPRSVLATDCGQAAMAGGIYHTAGAPGRWNKKVQSHLPVIELDKAQDGAKIRIQTRHTFDGYDHYIVKHMLLDKDFRFVDERMFNPTVDKAPISTFTLDAYQGPLHALSVCNKHDTWLNVIEV